jgi:hypothetical protein
MKKARKRKRSRHEYVTLPAPVVSHDTAHTPPPSNVSAWYWEMEALVVRGDTQPIVESLRSSKPVDDDVRIILAGYLAGTIKPFDGRRSKSKLVEARDFDDTLILVKEPGKRWYDAAAFIRQYKQERGGKRGIHEAALKAAEKEYGLTCDQLDNWLNHTKSERAERFGIRKVPAPPTLKKL